MISHRIYLKKLNKQKISMEGYNYCNFGSLRISCFEKEGFCKIHPKSWEFPQHSFSHLSWFEVPPVPGVWDITYFLGGLSNLWIWPSTYYFILLNKVRNNVHGLFQGMFSFSSFFYGPVWSVSKMLCSLWRVLWNQYTDSTCQLPPPSSYCFSLSCPRFLLTSLPLCPHATKVRVC